jgi:8-amino-7-oxononanoate synthase
VSAVAIVGMGCRFAGAPNLQAYWEQALAGRDAFGPIPADRWDHETFFNTSKRATDKSYAPKGAFIDDIRSFPALFLGIPPRRVEVMDPQQRFSLEVAIEAITDAGYKSDDLPERTGVFVGITATEYRVLLASRIIGQMMASGQLGQAPDDPIAFLESVDRVIPSRPFTAPGVLGNMCAATIAQELNLHGPAFTTDAACASALVALSDAVERLRSGSIDCAIAGGTYLCVTPEHHVAFTRIGAMSPTGECLPFDARANGFVQGDGAGLVVLKRLEDALADGDRIYAVIRGIAVNNDGRGDGPMAPLSEGQGTVVAAAWADAKVPFEKVGYVEAHGTGTEVGDRTELQGLKKHFSASASVALGSSKANIGHTMSAAGIAGLIRAALAVHHRVIPPMANFQSSKAELGLEGSSFYVPTAAQTWDADERVAGVSSFGFGGTNGHVVITNLDVETEAVDQLELVTLSAPTLDALRETCATTAAAIRLDPTITPASAARAWAMRPKQAARAALVARSRDDLLARLDTIAAGRRDPAVRVGVAEGKPKIAFLYPGQGSQRPGMLRQLARRFPVVDAALAEMGRELDGELTRPLDALLWPERRANPVDDATARAELTDTANCQPALLACGVALTRLLADVGVEPVVVTGHSLGEFTAATTAGVLSAGDAARFVARRGRAMNALPGDHGAMVAIFDEAEVVGSLLVDGAVIANINHPRQFAVSGETEAVKAVAAAAEAREIKAVMLEVSHGFHGPTLHALDPRPFVDPIAFADPKLPVASGISGTPYASASDARDVFLRHATSPVDFVGALGQCKAAGADLYLQVGAGGPLASFARGSLDDAGRGILTLSGMEDDDDASALLTTLAQLFVLGVNVDVRPIAGPGPIASLPPALLPREPYWAIQDRAQLPITWPGDRKSPARVRVEAAPEAAKPEVAPATSADAAPADEILDKVLGVVAKVSAYPRNSLVASMSLTEDLGFDSIMVGDLATGLADAFPGLGGIPQSLLMNKPKVQDLVDFVRNAASGEPALSDDDLALGAFAPGWVDAPATGLPPLPALRRLDIALFSADAALARSLEAAGHAVRVLSHGDALAAAPDAIVWACDDTLPSPALVLAGEAPCPDPAAPLLAAVETAAHLGGKPHLAVLAADGDVWAQASAGACKAIAREWPSSRIKHLTTDRAGADLAAIILGEWSNADRTVEIRDIGGNRQVPALSALDAAANALDLNDVVAISGGFRGIGLKLATRLAERGIKVVALGRSTPPGSGDLMGNGSADGASAAAGASATLTFLRADVEDRAALEAALRPYGVTALIHAAGSLADGALGTLDATQAAAARSVKVRGFLNTIAACGPTLKRATAVGSWAGRFGNRHQAHYAAGNALMAALTAVAPRGAIVTVGEFGPWTDSPMVKALPAPVIASLRADGVDFVGDEAGVQAILDDLGAATSGVRTHGRDLAPIVRRIELGFDLSIEDHPWLRDHAIDGVPVLPLAAAADLIAWGADLPAPFAVTDLTLYSGITVEPSISLKVVVDGDRVELRKGDRDTLAYRARVRPAPEAVAPARAPSEGDTAGLVSAFYDVTFHGRAFRGIVAADGLGADGVTGRVHTAPAAKWMPGRPSWKIDPLAFDSAMQLSAAVAWRRYQRAGTPVGFSSFVQLRPWPAGDVTVDARFGAQEGERFATDLVFSDAQGPFAWATEVAAKLARQDDDLDFEVKPEWTDPNLWGPVQDLQQRLSGLALIGLRNPYFQVHDGTAKNITSVGGRELVNYSSYNYIGLSGDPRVLADVEVAIHKYGTSVSASRVASGERPFHGELEQILATCQRAEDAILFTAGHATNVTTIGHLMGPNDLILHDELIHDSAIQGIKLSGAARRAFKHDDPRDLERQLKQLRKHYEKCLIVVEGVYSMDGDICDLPAYVKIKRKYGCMLMVDEAHSFGIVGATGCGLAEHFDLRPDDVDIWMGTLSKSLSSCGGWIAASKTLITYLRYTAPGFVYSAGLTPANGQAALTSVKLMLEEPWRVKRLQDNGSFFHAKCNEYGLDNGPAKGGSGVVPVITGNSMHALVLSQRLNDAGINVQPIVYPAVADNAARLRFFLSSTHTEEQLAWTAKVVADTLAQVRIDFAL